MKSVIVVVTHRSGTRFLENLLQSFKGYARYPILLVISDYDPSDETLFRDIRQKFSSLPILVEHIDRNAFEFGGLYTAYTRTDYEEFLLLSHSCEIRDTDLFRIVFEEHENKSVAFALQQGHWGEWFEGLPTRDKRFVLRHVGEDTHSRLTAQGNVTYWQGHIGKYRRAILEKMNMADYVPSNMLEAIAKSELLFTPAYQALDKDTVVLFPDWKDGDVFEERFGKVRMRIMNEYVIKWKSHWTPRMILDDLQGSIGVRAGIRRILGRLVR